MYRPFAADRNGAPNFEPSDFSQIGKLVLQTAMGPSAFDAMDPKTADLNPTVLIADDVANDMTTQASLAVNGAHVLSTINSVGDLDYFKVTLKAGQTYEFNMLSHLGGPAGAPLQDAYLEIYGANGQLLGLADGGAATTFNTLNSGFDASLQFTAPTDGTYFINARAFDQDPANGANGDGVGDYELFAKTVDPATAYRPLYTIDSPLHSIDWGSQIRGTSRNPDGDNGPRDNHSTFTGVTYDAIHNIAGKNVITYYFARQGDVFVDQNPATPGSTETMIQAKGMEDWEKAAFRLAMDQYEHVTDNVYIEVQNRAEADFKFITYQGTPGAGASLLGRMSPPGEENAGQAEFNAGDVRWTEEGLQQGGFYFPTLLHEMGHGHGMAHPHDTGGRSSVMRGSDDGSVIGGGTADFDLSQQVFTVMSYNDGWTTDPDGQPSSGDLTGLNADPFGWMGTLGPLDIAVMQDKYGVNEDWAKGDDTYTLPDVNAPGTFFQAIWDAGGHDQIVYDGARNATIDLRAATLKYEEGGGGRMSWAQGVYGGYDIANGVTIEDARTGSGNDILNGNDAANVLSAGAGADTLSGGAGRDTLAGGAGDDRLTGGDGVDLFRIDGLPGRDTITDFVRGVDHIDLTAASPHRFKDLWISVETHDGLTGAVVTWDDGSASMWLPGVSPSALRASDFVFG